jgi:hypothetical protein
VGFAPLSGSSRWRGVFVGDTWHASQRGRGLLEKSLREYGAGRSVLADRNGVLIAGNKTHEVATEIGLPVRIIETDGNELVVVQRTDLDLSRDKAAVELGIADNRVGQVSLEWDIDVLSELAAEEIHLSKFWSDDEIAELLGTPKPVADDPGAQVDRADELRQKWQTERGQLWQVGRHRLLCGDSTNADDVARLMGGERAAMVFTDPPYGVEYEGGTVKRDALAGDETPSLYEPALRLIAEYSIPKVAVYLWHSDSKSQAQFGALGAQYKTKHEPCYYLFKRGQSPQWFGPTNEVTVWYVARENANEYHPTQKPPELAVRAMENSSQHGDIVLDLFLGSGSTMVAAEQAGRTCYGCEIAPGYAATILERLTGLGLDARRLD